MDFGKQIDVFYRLSRKHSVPVRQQAGLYHIGVELVSGHGTYFLENLRQAFLPFTARQLAQVLGESQDPTQNRNFLPFLAGGRSRAVVARILMANRLQDPVQAAVRARGEWRGGTFLDALEAM